MHFGKSFIKTKFIFHKIFIWMSTYLFEQENLADILQFKLKKLWKTLWGRTWPFWGEWGVWRQTVFSFAHLFRHLFFSFSSRILSLYNVKNLLLNFLTFTSSHLYVIWDASLSLSNFPIKFDIRLIGFTPTYLQFWAKGAILVVTCESYTRRWSCKCDNTNYTWNQYEISVV